MNKIKYTIASLLIVSTLVQCDSLVDDPDLPIPMDETLSNTGAFLRMTKINTSVFDLANSDAAYEFVGEYFDNDGASLLESITVFSSYRSFALPGTTPTVYDEAEIMTISNGEFSVNEDTGLPTALISIPLSKVIAGIPQLDAADVGVEDRFQLRWRLNLTDGRTFSVEDASPALSGGFYKSPYGANVPTVQALDPSEFTGSYTFTRIDEGPGPLVSPFFGGTYGTFDYLFGKVPFTAELSIDPNNTLNGRVVDLPGAYPNSIIPLDPMTDVQLSIGRTAQVAATFPVGVGCDLDIAIGSPSNNGIREIDVNDDSSFILAMSENKNSDCGRGSGDIFFTVTKN